MNNIVPTNFIVAQGNAFFRVGTTVMAAPVLTKWGGEVEWTEAVEVVRQDTEDTEVLDAIFRALYVIGSAEEGERLPRLAALLTETPPWQAPAKSTFHTVRLTHAGAVDLITLIANQINSYGARLDIEITGDNVVFSTSFNGARTQVAGALD